MDSSEKKEIAQKVIKVIQNLQTGENEWVDLANIGAPLVGGGIQYKQFGFLKLRPFLNKLSDVLEFKDNCVTGKPPVYYVRIKVGAQSEEAEDFVKSKSSSVVSPTSNSNYASPEKSPTEDSWLFTWASIPNVMINHLAEMALPGEKWYYGKVEPKTELKCPILKNYLGYTFKRLVHEKKIKIQRNEKDNMDYAAFNTGLVDRKYECIYALFKHTDRFPHYYWYLVNFVVAGEDAGKTLVSLFSPLPAKADYIQNKIDNIRYDTSADLPSWDCKHILVEHTERLPIDFYHNNCPNGFTRIDGVEIDEVYGKKDSDDSKRKYFKALGEKIMNDKEVLKSLRNRIQYAITLAVKRVDWNYRTAIPMYFPSQDNTSLLLPLALVNDARVDVALVVQRQQSGAYQGETVLPLAWAYNDSRLVTRPDSDWLKTDIIQEPYNEEMGE